MSSNLKRFVLRSALIGLTAFQLFSCATESENSLRGSINSTYSLDFDEVRVTLLESGDLSIIYASSVSNSSEQEEALNLTLDRERVSIEENVEIDLINASTLTRFRIETVNNQEEEDSDPFPTLKSGVLTFSQFELLLGTEIKGEFTISFINGDTLLGDFSAPLEFETSQ